MKLNINKRRLKEIIKEEVEKFVETIQEEEQEQEKVINADSLEQIIRKEILKTLNQD
tara:strand:+ start:1089 stop:1259 length:171 start_codon:yes stop_codon:yes gene_type:complete